jgi:hypothetical protein
MAGDVTLKLQIGKEKPSADYADYADYADFELGK